MSVLKGIRVVEFATYIAGPAAATVMADFGAEVIKIERLPGGDPYRYLSALPTMPEADSNYCWILSGRNKKSIGLDVSKPEGREVFLKLVESADILVTNVQPDALAKLKLGYEDVAGRNPRLIYAQMTGYGERGPDVDRPGFDMTAFWARSGLMDSVHNADSDPALSVAGQGDHPTSMAMLSGILLALYDRERTGRGTKVSSSLIANGVWANACNVQAALCGAGYQRRTRKTVLNPVINHYATRDGKRFLLCGVQTAIDWPKLCRAVEHPEWLEDPRFATPEARSANAPELVSLLDEIFASKTFDEWIGIFHQVQIPFGPVSSNADVAADEQMRAAGVIVPLDDPRYPGLETVNSPFWLAGREKALPGRAPDIGEHTREVLAEIGLDEARVAQLLARGIAGSAIK
ncbi:MAG: CoA transferase [Bryobacteraceae bacterium]|nr:CoA transferase [Bryobacteraceae bacterium]